MALKTRTSSNVGRRGERGFTMVQMVVTVVIVAIVTTFAVVQIAAARDHMRLTGATQEFAGYTEKARLDAIRRHGGTFGPPLPPPCGNDSKVTLDSTLRYMLCYDFDYDGSSAAKPMKLPEGVTVKEIAVISAAGTEVKVPTAANPVTITFDMYGRTANAYRITFTNQRGHESVVGITAAGEVSLDRRAIMLTAGSYVEISGDSGSLGPNGWMPGGGTTTGGGTTGGGTTGGGDTTGGGTTGGGTSGGDTGGGTTGGGDTTGGTTGGGTPQPCTMTVSPSNTQATAVALHNGNNSLAHSTNITVTFANPTAAATFTVSQTGNHLNISQSGNTVTVTVKNGNGNQGLYSVLITPSTGCGTAKTIYINVAE